MAATCVVHDQRIRRELQTLRRKEVICASPLNSSIAISLSRSCSRCRGELGRIINRGACCPSCGQRVCKSCRQYGASPTQWLCTICHTQLELKTTTGWMNEIMNKKCDSSATETVKRTIQRSWTFSDVSPSPWTFLRGSPEMRAYSSMPRHQDVECIRQYLPIYQQKTEVSNTTLEMETENSSAVIPDCNVSSEPLEKTEENNDQPLDKETIEPLTGIMFRKVTIKEDTKCLPPGVTPPRSRRRFLAPSDVHEEYLEQTNFFTEKGFESEDYKLVFISSSETSSREELHSSDECSSTTSGLMEWDYFECWGGQKRLEGISDLPVPAHRSLSVSESPIKCVCIPVPFPVPVPIPVFVPFPVPAMTTSRGYPLPKSEVLPSDEALSISAVSPVITQQECDSVVLTVYKTLDTSEPAIINGPESILRINEAKLGDFTGLGDDSSVSSMSSDEDDQRVPSTKIYELKRSDESSGEFSLATPNGSDSDSADSVDGNFSRTLVLHESDDDDMDPLEEKLSELSEDNIINSIITFSNVEVCHIVRDFLNEERKYFERNEDPVPVKIPLDEVPETRSNTSDEFSGTESMEMPLEDSLECRNDGGSKNKGVGESGRYTSLVMITQEQGTPNKPKEDTQVTVVTGNTLSACLEEGLADDDSWVEDLDQEHLTTTEESSEEETYQEERFQRTAIDFTLHTIAEESCEESEVETEKQTELEKYFFYGLSDNFNEEKDEDTVSETSSIYSEGVESTGGQIESKTDPAELASSRLEKYFLSGFMGFSRRDSDGSVGSDSEGRPSPEQRRKRLVRARGTGRQHSNSLDNLAEPSEGEAQTEPGEGSSTETDSHDEQNISFDKIDGQFDTVKRTKKKKRIQSSQSELPDFLADKTEEKKIEPLENSKKQTSRDSGFVGSFDDLLKQSENVKQDDSKKEVKNPPSTALIRKDSFNNWSSDEETNLMMSKMRAFFKTMVGSQPKGTSPDVKAKTKPPQLVYFESELTRLMKTVPGLKDEQVREIVEYLSSEDTWSDSYDSSDYTSSDLENSNKRSALQEEISASCRQIISKFESGDDSKPLEDGKDMVYQRLVASLNKIEAPMKESNQNSPVMIEKVMQHIGSRLWALMHEVSNVEGTTPRTAKYHKRLSSKLSASTTEEEEEEKEEYEEVSVEDYMLPRSKSHDPLLEENRQEASDNERFSWRGSFESALMASDSRTRLACGGESSASALALAAKRRSAGDLMFKSYSREQLDRVRSCGSIGGSVEDRIWSREEKRIRRSSVPDSPGNSAEDEDSDEPGTRATLPRSLQVSCSTATNSLPRLPTSPISASAPMYKSHSVHQFSVKSARYRPPGYRGSPLAPPPRKDRRRNNSSGTTTGGEDSPGLEPTSLKSQEDEVDRLLCHRASLGARSDSLASVYSGAGEGRHSGVTVKGEVQFGLQYNYKQSSLEIHIKQCKDLASVDTKRNRSDPYVKVYLLPDKSKSGKRKTRVKKHTLNPVFDEVLRFNVNLDGLEHRTLWLSVCHSDMFGRNDFLGEVLMPLENKVFDDPLPKFYPLQERSEPLEELNSKGELIVGLKYETPDDSSKKRPSKGCLYVLVKEAKNLPPIKSNGSSDPFCKSYLLPDKGRGSKQKAPVIRKTCNPLWNHTFTYNNVSVEELANRSLELTIWDHDRLASNEFLGGVRLNIGSGKYNDKNVDWMDSSGNEISLWQRMLEKPNLWVESCLPLRPTLDLRSSL